MKTKAGKAKKADATKSEPPAATPLTKSKVRKPPFLPYQLRWINDDSPLKLGDKSRRTGWTWSEAFDAVSRRFRPSNPANRDYWFSSADESAAAEFNDYCRWWAKDLFGAIADQYVDQVGDDSSQSKSTAYITRCPNGHKIVAMSSNPRRFRSKGGDVCLDEFAFHEEAEAMLTAAAPVTTWGGSLRIFSTPNGESTVFNRLVKSCQRVIAAMGYDPLHPPLVAFAQMRAAADAIRAGMVLSYHRVTIEGAIEQGIVEKIAEQRGTPLSRDEFRSECRAKCIDDESYQQEYGCIASANAESWLSYATIEQCESAECPAVDAPLAGYKGGRCVVGIDVARKRDLTVIWVLEPVGDVWWTRQIKTLTKMSLPDQQAEIEGMLRQVKWNSVYVDQTGLGLGLYEYLALKVGGDVQGYTFTGPSKQALAVRMKQMFEDRAVRIPADDGALRDALHKVRKVAGPGGTVKFDAARDDAGHADEFWALALAGEAAMGGVRGGFWYPGKP
ncbi:MAG: hypothetical protein SF069_03005 [Phycisphaerae bacterium]|nr:hypothetical protein [Phycisphaerae bacterium]